jgi:hypothetical protein
VAEGVGVRHRDVAIKSVTGGSVRVEFVVYQVAGVYAAQTGVRAKLQDRASASSLSWLVLKRTGAAVERAVVVEWERVHASDGKGGFSNWLVWRRLHGWQLALTLVGSILVSACGCIAAYAVRRRRKAAESPPDVVLTSTARSVPDVAAGAV